MNVTYARRKAAGICPRCLGAPKPGCVYCTACLVAIAQRLRQPRPSLVPHPTLPLFVRPTQEDTP